MKTYDICSNLNRIQIWLRLSFYYLYFHLYFHPVFHRFHIQTVDWEVLKMGYCEPQRLVLLFVNILVLLFFFLFIWSSLYSIQQCFFLNEAFLTKVTFDVSRYSRNSFTALPQLFGKTVRLSFRTPRKHEIGSWELGVDFEQHKILKHSLQVDSEVKTKVVCHL